MPRLRVLFMGTPEFACPTLKMLLEHSGVEVIGVVTQPDRPKGRGQKLAQPPVKSLAIQHGVHVYQPAKVRAPEFIQTIQDLNPDLIVVVAFGQILPKSLLDIPRLGCINVHASLLPRYRGAAPINWSIINGDSKTGVTTMLMDVGLDTGDMLICRETPIFPDEDAESLYNRLSLLGAETMTETLEALVAGQLAPVKQDDAAACYAPMLKKEMGKIVWDQPAETVRNLVRGLTPWPGAFTYLHGQTLKINRATLADGSGEPGTILKAEKAGIEVACGQGSLVIQELQPEGKRKMFAADFLAGNRLEIGTKLE